MNLYEKFKTGECELKVYVYTRPNLRAYSIEMESYMGRNILDNCFDEFKIDGETTEIFFSFPERWLNILEQRELYDRLDKYYPNLKKVTIKTHSVYIIQCTPSRHIGIVDDSSLIPEGKGLDKLYIENVGDIFSENGLNVL